MYSDFLSHTAPAPDDDFSKSRFHTWKKKKTQEPVPSSSSSPPSPAHIALQHLESSLTTGIPPGVTTKVSTHLPSDNSIPFQDLHQSSSSSLPPSDKEPVKPQLPLPKKKKERQKPVSSSSTPPPPAVNIALQRLESSLAKGVSSDFTAKISTYLSSDKPIPCKDLHKLSQLLLKALNLQPKKAQREALQQLVARTLRSLVASKTVDVPALDHARNIMLLLETPGVKGYADIIQPCLQGLTTDMTPKARILCQDHLKKLWSQKREDDCQAFLAGGADIFSEEAAPDIVCDIIKVWAGGKEADVERAMDMLCRIAPTNLQLWSQWWTIACKCHNSDQILTAWKHFLVYLDDFKSLNLDYKLTQTCFSNMVKAVQRCNQNAVMTLLHEYNTIMPQQLTLALLEKAITLFSLSETGDLDKDDIDVMTKSYCTLSSENRSVIGSKICCFLFEQLEKERIEAANHIFSYFIGALKEQSRQTMHENQFVTFIDPILTMLESHIPIDWNDDSTVVAKCFCNLLLWLPIELRNFVLNMPKVGRVRLQRIMRKIYPQLLMGMAKGSSEHQEILNALLSLLPTVPDEATHSLLKQLCDGDIPDKSRLATFLHPPGDHDHIASGKLLPLCRAMAALLLKRGAYERVDQILSAVTTSGIYQKASLATAAAIGISQLITNPTKDPNVEPSPALKHYCHTWQKSILSDCVTLLKRFPNDAEVVSCCTSILSECCLNGNLDYSEMADSYEALIAELVREIPGIGNSSLATPAVRDLVESMRYFYSNATDTMKRGLMRTLLDLLERQISDSGYVFSNLALVLFVGTDIPFTKPESVQDSEIYSDCWKDHNQKLLAESSKKGVSSHIPSLLWDSLKWMLEATRYLDQPTQNAATVQRIRTGVNTWLSLSKNLFTSYIQQKKEKALEEVMTEFSSLIMTFLKDTKTPTKIRVLFQSKWAELLTELTKQSSQSPCYQILLNHRLSWHRAMKKLGLAPIQPSSSATCSSSLPLSETSLAKLQECRSFLSKVGQEEKVGAAFQELISTTNSSDIPTLRRIITPVFQDLITTMTNGLKEESIRAAGLLVRLLTISPTTNSSAGFPDNRLPKEVRELILELKPNPVEALAKIMNWYAEDELGEFQHTIAEPLFRGLGCYPPSHCSTSSSSSMPPPVEKMSPQLVKALLSYIQIVTKRAAGLKNGKRSTMEAANTLLQLVRHYPIDGQRKDTGLKVVTEALYPILASNIASNPGPDDREVFQALLDALPGYPTQTVYHLLLRLNGPDRTLSSELIAAFLRPTYEGGMSAGGDYLMCYALVTSLLNRQDYAGADQILTALLDDSERTPLLAANGLLATASNIINVEIKRLGTNHSEALIPYWQRWQERVLERCIDIINKQHSSPFFHSDAAHMLHQCYANEFPVTEKIDALSDQIVNKLLSASPSHCNAPMAIPDFDHLIKTLRLRHARAIGARQKMCQQIGLQTLKRCLSDSQELHGRLASLLLFGDGDVCTAPGGIENSDAYVALWRQCDEFITTTSRKKIMDTETAKENLNRSIKWIQHALQFIHQAPSNPATIECMKTVIDKWVQWAKGILVGCLLLQNDYALNDFLSDMSHDVLDLLRQAAVIPDLSNILASKWLSIIEESISYGATSSQCRSVLQTHRQKWARIISNNKLATRE